MITCPSSNGLTLDTVTHATNYIACNLYMVKRMYLFEFNALYILTASYVCYISLSEQNNFPLYHKLLVDTFSPISRLYHTFS